MSNLIETLNQNLGKTPDEIVTAISDPFSKWQSLTRGITPDNWESVQDRQIALYYYDGTDHQRGFFCTNRQHFNGSYSYRCDSADYTSPHNTRDYRPSDAENCGGWWFIGWDHRHVPVPTTAAEQSHCEYSNQEEYDDDEELD